MARVELVYKSFKVPKPLWEAAEQLIESGEYANDSELIRDALRVFLEKKGVKL